MEQFDVLVVGSGGAGMRAALEVGRRKGLKVALITKIFPTRSATAMAQGGVNACLNNVAAEDTVETHTFDTVKGSDYLGDQDAIEFFCSRCPEGVLEMDHMGAPFSRTEENKIAQRNFGGQSYPRTCYSADKTGHVILHTTYEQCLKEGVHFLQEWYLLDLVKDANGHVGGAVVWNMKEGKVEQIKAKAIILSTGGAGRIFWTRTTNPFLSTGDGMAVAFRAGNGLKDMEMIQFHPTGLGRTGILMSEAVRGEGGYLLNAEGERFMKKYAPNKMELASRDVVAKAIEDEIAAGRGFGSGLNAYVVADLRHLGPEVIIEKLHGIRDLAMTFEHCDPLTQPVPIRPTCHYTMGGIDVVDYKTCACELPGLFASGEASCISIHGANRLGGNSLADGVVFGKVSGAGAADYAESHEQPNVDAELAAAAKAWEDRFTEVTSREGGRPVVEIRDALADAMWNKVGIFRNEEGITEALKEIEQLIEDYKTCYVGDPERTYNMAFVNYCEIGSMLTVAKAIAMGALHRRESRGAHIREDHPKRNDERYLKHSLIKLGADGQYELTERDVVFTKYEPQERKY
ncbi:FAD-binding protein [Veillonella denticariosi JCM 15641]|uniref:FAD-binding protein n=1 Tax=Veillonella denticariosi JCM 15641 TaxID=1298594 RepID=A0A2S7ZAM9_9FIRM|nr:FAD-binding protein [Veillonella denticariosi]PQL20270.1 FAD-binding protein [Veillonella denticariosi JCM 15641]